MCSIDFLLLVSWKFRQICSISFLSWISILPENLHVLFNQKFQRLLENLYVFDQDFSIIFIYLTFNTIFEFVRAHGRLVRVSPDFLASNTSCIKTLAKSKRKERQVHPVLPFILRRLNLVLSSDNYLNYTLLI